MSVGDFVEVPLGSRRVKAVVWGESKDESPRIKDIFRRIDIPPMQEPLRKLIDWTASYNLAPAGTVLKMSMSIAKALEPEKPVTAYKLAGIGDVKITSARQKVIDALSCEQILTIAKIQEKSGATKAVIKSLIDKGGLKKIEVEKTYHPPALAATHVDLSPYQAEAAENLIGKVKSEKYSATLLDGVTGSGKTEVYFEAVEQAFAEDGAQVLIMLPEIILTNQLVARFKKRFGFEPVVWHSNITAKQRENNYRQIQNGTARLVIGARSALFLPYKNLKLIVVDEEHDASYKQEEGVIYQARDMAVVRAHLEKIPIILASATPSIETVENVKSGKYDELKLPSRHGGAVMPDIKIVDMRKESVNKRTWLSPSLRSALASNINRSKQSILFLNRRGYAPLTLCQSCGHRFCCPDCSAWLVEHRNPSRLTCHHCGYRHGIPKTCPKCEKEDSLVSCGPGVERIAEEVSKNFPDAKISLMTSDNIANADEAATAVDQITNGEVDVIIGTQILAKGHHFPNLTLVGIIDADLGLAGGDLRAAERCYQLLHQVSGRAGREKEKGTVIIQSYMPENSVIQALASGDRDAFIDMEAHSRKLSNMPPYSRLAGIIISGPVEANVIKTAKDIARTAPANQDVRLLGPVPAPIYLLRGNYRYRILLRSPRNINIQKWVKSLLSAVKIPSNVRVKVDIDPYSFG